MQFTVRALDERSQITTLRIDGTDADDARAQVLRMHLAPVSVQFQVARASGNRKAFDVTLFAEEVRMLLDAGLSLIDALDGLAERETSPERQAALAGLASGLREGASLATAMARQPASFPELFVGIVRAAETTSNLSGALEKYVVYEQQLRSLRERMTSAAIYPGILLIVGSAVTMFLMLYVVPRFASVYRSSGHSLPWASQLLLDTGSALSHNLPLVSVAFAAFGFAGWRAWARYRTGGRWLALLLLVPGARRRIATIEMARLFRTLSMLIEGGLPVRDALGLSAHVLSDARRQAVGAVRSAVEGGASLSDSLARAGLSTPLALRLLRVGERSGRLGTMLERTALFHEHETAQWIDRLSKTFAPALMILISVLVGAIVIFLYIPVFDLAASFQ